MHCEVLGWPADEPTLRLDYRDFAYAGKFVMSSTGTAVLHERDTPVTKTDEDPTAAFASRDSESFASDVVAAVAFNEDRTADDVLWLRYVTVHRDRRGEGLAARLIGFVRDRALERRYDRLRIAVNNPYSYEALYKSGFEFTGRETGIAELVLDYRGTDVEPATANGGRSGEDTFARNRRYRAGLDIFADRGDLEPAERAFVERKRERGPPQVTD